MDMSRRIDILLSTYNGADYLNLQLASIATQDIDEWRLMIRDDGSTDNSVAIIKKLHWTTLAEFLLSQNHQLYSKRQIAKPLEIYMQKYTNRNLAILKVYKSGYYNMQEIGDFFELHYSSISRIISSLRNAQ